MADSKQSGNEKSLLKNKCIVKLFWGKNYVAMWLRHVHQNKNIATVYTNPFR